MELGSPSFGEKISNQPEVKTKERPKIIYRQSRSGIKNFSTAKIHKHYLVIRFFFISSIRYDKTHR